MADLRSQRRIEELEGDREALEHIARALEGRVLPGPGAIATSQAARPADSLALTPAGLAILLESMPAAVGILAGGALIHINTAFAYAFGYRSASELIDAGGLAAIVQGGASLIPHENGAERSAPTRWARRSVSRS